MTEDPTAPYRSPSLDLPGAVPADAPDAGVPAHYGNPHVEQRRLVGGEGFVDLSHRDVLRVGGTDRLSWLHSLTTQYLTDLAPGVATEAFVLSPHGHVEHALYLVDDGTATWLHTEPGAGAALLDFLQRMRFLLDVDPRLVSDEYALVHEAGGAREPGTGTAVDAVVTRAVDGGRELFLPRTALADYLKHAAHPAGMWAYEALRVAARRPRLGLETDHRTIPNELGALAEDGRPGAVHLDKGCYRGQETVARVHNLGQPPRRLVFLHLDGSGERLPAHGDPVVLEDREVGFVTSTARHYQLGPIGMALVKRNVPVAAVLSAGGVPAAQEVIVEPGSGAGRRPKLGQPTG
jgi:folate-binding protein YgfZ